MRLGSIIGDMYCQDTQFAGISRENGWDCVTNCRYSGSGSLVLKLTPGEVYKGTAG